MNKFGRRTYEEGYALEKLKEKCFVFLNKQFTKLSIDKKLYVALEIVKRSMPAKVEGEVKGGETNILILHSSKEQKQVEDRHIPQAISGELPT